MADGRVTVTGNVGREPLVKSTSKGEVVEFSLACTPRVQREGGGWADGETVWYRVSAWDRLGRNTAASLHRGEPVIVQGVLRTEEWTGQDGVVRSGRDIRASAIGHDLAAGTATFVRSASRSGATAPGPAAAATPVTPGVVAAAPVQPVGSEQRTPGDWGAPAPEPAPPAPAGWSTEHEAEEAETPF